MNSSLIRNVLIAMYLLIPSSLLAAPTWRNIGPGGGGWVPSLAVSPVDSNTVYAGCDVGGFYRSRDGGKSWQISNMGLQDYYVEVIAPHPTDRNVIYLGTQGGVHKSVDGGDTWVLMRDGFPPTDLYRFTAPIEALAIDPRQPNTLYAGVGRARNGDFGVSAIYRTDDGGAHWRDLIAAEHGMESGAIIMDLLVRPDDNRIVFAATNKGLYRSANSGASWSRLTTGLPHGSLGRIALCKARPNTLYISVISPPGEKPWRGGVYRSDDGGDTWQPRLSGLGTQVGKPGEPSEMTSNIDRLVVDARNPDIAYGGDRAWVSAGVYRTTDGGLHWQRTVDYRDGATQTGWLTEFGPAVTGLAIDPRAPTTLFFSTSGHIFRSTDGAAHWQGVYTRQVERPSTAPRGVDTLWATTGVETTCLNSVAVDPSDANRLYACYFDVGLFQSFDGGRTFARTVTGMAHRGNCFTVAFVGGKSDTVFAGTGEWASNHGDVCRSDDRGITWKVVGKPDNGLPDGQTHHIVVDSTSSPASPRVYVSVEGAGVYCSGDGGGSWKARNGGLPTASVRGLAISRRSSVRVYALMSGSPEKGGGLYISDDRGDSWQKTANACPWADPTNLAVCSSNPKRIYVAAREAYTDGKLYPGGVYASSDGGITWRQVLKDRFIQGLAVDPQNPDSVFAGGNDHPYHDGATGSGVWRTTNGGETWVSMTTPSLTCKAISVLALDPRKPQRLYAGTGGNGFFVCTP